MNNYYNKPYYNIINCSFCPRRSVQTVFLRAIMCFERFFCNGRHYILRVDTVRTRGRPPTRIRSRVAPTNTTTSKQISIIIIDLDFPENPFSVNTSTSVEKKTKKRPPHLWISEFVILPRKKKKKLIFYMFSLLYNTTRIVYTLNIITCARARTFVQTRFLRCDEVDGANRQIVRGDFFLTMCQ